VTEFDNNAADDAAADGSTGARGAADAGIDLPALNVEDEAYGVTAEDKYNEAAEDEADDAWAKAAAELQVEQAADEAPASAGEPEPVDPIEELRAELRRAPGDWFVVHSYAGYENKVKTNLESRRFPPRKSSRSRTASASRSTARSSPATSWSGWNSPTIPGAPSATLPA